jgi:hypothetical protein
MLGCVSTVVSHPKYCANPFQIKLLTLGSISGNISKRQEREEYIFCLTIFYTYILNLNCCTICLTAQVRMNRKSSAWNCLINPECLHFLAQLTKYEAAVEFTDRVQKCDSDRVCMAEFSENSAVSTWYCSCILCTKFQAFLLTTSC